MSGVSNGLVMGNNNNLNMSTDSSEVEIEGNNNSYSNTIGSDKVSLKGNSSSRTRYIANEFSFT